MSRLANIGSAPWLIAPALVIFGAVVSAFACPFCDQVSQTFSQEVSGAAVAVIARLAEAPPKPAPTGLGDPLAKTRFEIVDTLRGAPALGGLKKFDAVYFGDNPVGTTFLITALAGSEPGEKDSLNWSTPILMDARGCEYLKGALGLPAEGPDRLAYFQNYLEDRNETLARDAFDEFARAPYAEVKQLKGRMQRDKLREWVASPQVTPSRRQLYFTMLGICGDDQDRAMLEGLLTSTDRAKRTGLNAIIAAYLTLKGPEGVDLVENLFLKDPKAEYIDTLAAIIALRFQGEEETIVPRGRVLAALRTMLDRPQLADLVIRDLARWEDWSAMNRLVQLFQEADADTSWVRVPVIKYLQECPLPEAKAELEKCAKLDPQAYRQAKAYVMYGGAAPSSKIPAGDKSPRKADPATAGDKVKPAAETKAPTQDTPAKKTSQAPAAPRAAAMSVAFAADASTAAAPSPSIEPAAGGEPSREASVTGAVDRASDAGAEPAAESTERAERATESAAQAARPTGAVAAAIGVTPLAVAAIAEPSRREIAPWQIGGVMLCAACALFGAIWWLLTAA